jgi:alpha-maltose-1-phosphate synthase
MMRVALIVFKALPIYGIQLGNGLCRSADVHLFITEDALHLYGDFIDHKISIHPIKTRRYRDPRGILASLKIIKDIRKYGCEVAHLTLHEPIFNVLIPFIRSFPLVTTVHDVTPHIGDARTSRMLKAISDISLRHSDGLIVHGEKLRNELCSRYGIKDEDVTTIPHMNYSFYRNWEGQLAQEETNNILFFGSIWEYKGLKYLMLAEPIIAQKIEKFKITIAGKGEDFSKYHQYMRKQDHYTIVNERIPDEKVAEFFQKATVVVLPYIEASQTGIVPIAFSFGKPVVCTNVGSIPEIVDHGVNGLIVAPADPEALANAIISILQDQQLRFRLSEKAREKAYTELSWESIGERHLHVYKKTVAKHRGDTKARGSF